MVNPTLALRSAGRVLHFISTGPDPYIDSTLTCTALGTLSKFYEDAFWVEVADKADSVHMPELRILIGIERKLGLIWPRNSSNGLNDVMSEIMVTFPLFRSQNFPSIGQEVDLNIYLPLLANRTRAYYALPFSKIRSIGLTDRLHILRKVSMELKAHLSPCCL